MQSSNPRPGFTSFARPRSGATYQRTLGLPLPMLAKPIADLTDFSDSKRFAASKDSLRRYQQPVPMYPSLGYGNQGPNYAHHQQQTSHPGLQYPVMPQNQRTPPVYTGGSLSRHDSQSTFADENYGQNQTRTSAPVKQFQCAHCDKRFARRSDLARHERIHSGQRPHTCDWDGCGKGFIQRSALTVHYRVHTGEKPHLCSHCSKPFSDSSSLARHRRIHSGKRPYKCEFQNCQKTFTRRTTLTRHQNHHAGTTREQAAAEVAAALSAGQPQNQTNYMSESDSSPQDTLRPSPPTRPLTGSSHNELPPMAIGTQRQNSEYAFSSQALPTLGHLRQDFQQIGPRSTSPLTPYALHSYTSAPQQQRSTTSYPASYCPPQPMEPPANGTGSGAASPHLGWHSPNHGPLPPPFALDNPGFTDSALSQHHQLGGHQLSNPLMGTQQLYYPTNSLGRPQSTEPRDYGLQQHQTHMSSQMLPSEWNHLPQANQQSRTNSYGGWRNDLPVRHLGDEEALNDQLYAMRNTEPQITKT